MTAVSGAVPDNDKWRDKMRSSKSFHSRMRFWSSTTMPLTNTVRDTLAAKLPAMPPNCSVGVTTASSGCKTGSRLTTAMMRS